MKQASDREEGGKAVDEKYKYLWIYNERLRYAREEGRRKGYVTIKRNALGTVREVEGVPYVG